MPRARLSGLGRPVEQCVELPQPFVADRQGQDVTLVNDVVRAGVTVPGHRARIERLCRHVLRPPVTGDRLAAAHGERC